MKVVQAACSGQALTYSAVRSVFPRRALRAKTMDLSTALAEMLARLEIARKAETLQKEWGDVPRRVFGTNVGTAMDESKYGK